jgi:hypothetical protein
LHVGATLRGVAGSLALIASRLKLDLDTPAFSTVRSWILRLGCHALTCSLRIGVWVYLIDHSVQIGSSKLLVILGCPVSDVPRERPLQHRDLRLVGLSLMEHSNAESVAAELERASKRTGIPRQIVSDNGTDLNGGVKLFQQQHEGVAHVHDLAHQAANVLKQRRKHDQRWSEFVAKLATAGAQVRQTREAHLCPPTMRPKARFMNLAPMVRFANRLLRLLDTHEASARAEACYGWLREYRDSLTNWTSEQIVVEVALTHIRTHGLDCETATKLDAAWSELSLTAGASEVATRLRTAVRVEGLQAEAGEKLVASTEVLESVFGKLKRLEGSYSGDGFTGLSLAVGAFLSESSEERVREALESVPKKEAESWARKLFGPTVQMVRRLFVTTPESVPNPG